MIIPHKKVYLIDVQELSDQKWFNFFREYLGDRINGNDTAYDLYWDEFGWSEKYDDPDTDLASLEKEFKALGMSAGIPEFAEVYLKFCW